MYIFTFFSLFFIFQLFDVLFFNNSLFKQVKDGSNPYQSQQVKLLPKNLLYQTSALAFIKKQIMISTIFLAILFILVSISVSHNPVMSPTPLRITLVTAWWPNQGSSEIIPTGQYMQAFKKLLKLPHNLIVFGQKPLSDVVKKERQQNNTMFFEHGASAIKDSWYNKQVNELKKKGKTNKATDSASPTLTYSRMILLGKANQNDPFKTDQFIWVDPNALASPQIANLLKPNYLAPLFDAFQHHFFMLPVPKNEQIHVLPNIQKTYYFEKYETFVSSQVFGGKTQTIKTVKTLYEDLLKVIHEFDQNPWSQDVILGLLADRFPWTISFLSIEFSQAAKNSNNNSNHNRLLNEVNNEFVLQKEQEQIQYYEWLFGWIEVGIVVVALLLAYEIFKYLNLTKKLYQAQGSQIEAEGSSLASDRE